jgi:hypothetical protein
MDMRNDEGTRRIQFEAARRCVEVVKATGLKGYPKRLTLVWALLAIMPDRPKARKKMADDLIDDFCSRVDGDTLAEVRRLVNEGDPMRRMRDREKMTKAMAGD